MTAPGKLHAFLLRSNETPANVFSRTPAFAWTPVRGAQRYEFLLSTTPLFTSSGLVWDDTTLTSPAAAVPVTLPWITGNPYSLYARVRAIAANGAVGPWSTSFGFNMQWSAVPTQLTGGPGYVRWTPIDGATSYQVWYVNLDTGGGFSKVITTVTNVADEREYYSFHQTGGWMGTVQWRVRAVRRLTDTTGPANGLPAVSYGPWSPVFTSTNPDFAHGALTLGNAVSDATSTALLPTAHRLMPVFTFSGDQALNGVGHELYRVYVFTDRDCLNMVFKGSIVGSPAFAPRTSGPLNIPKSMKALGRARLKDLGDGTDPKQLTKDALSITSTEATAASVFTATLIQQPTAPATGGTGGTTPPPTGGPKPFPGTLTGAGAAVDLWDTQWPSGRYYWTAVPVQWYIDIPPDDDGSIAGSSDPPLVYYDQDVPQDACKAGRIASFGKTSEPVVTSSSTPYASGLSVGGRLAPAATKNPVFAGAPLVAWQPALGASAYEVQWSRTSYPWRPSGNLFTFSTSANLKLAPGRWYYRVRGIDLSLPSGAAQMAWSQNIGLVVAKPKFKIG
jgi:hypothetical protein